MKRIQILQLLVLVCISVNIAVASTTIPYSQMTHLHYQNSCVVKRIERGNCVDSVKIILLHLHILIIGNV